MSSDESDDDLLASLLATAKDDDDPKPSNGASSKQPKPSNTASSEQSKPPDTASSSQAKPSTLRELDYDFCDDLFADDFFDDTPKTASQKTTKNSVLENRGDSSDDEDGKYFEKQQYSDYGKDIKNLLKNKESESSELGSGFRRETNFDNPLNKLKSTPKSSNIHSKASSSNSSLPISFSKFSLQAPSNTPVQKDVYSDPIFGLRMINPLVSSAELTEKMQGRKAVTVSGVQLHLAKASAGDCTDDWVIAGVLFNKSPVKTSQKGKQYCIWKITDLSTDLKSVTVFLFSGAHKQFWKIPTGAVVGILNPSVMESREDNNLATLSVDNAQKIMVLGTSKDLGKCKSMKKNGDPCIAPINLRYGEYCVYHVKQAYGKFSRRSELQSMVPQRAFGASKNTQNNLNGRSLSQQRHPEANQFIAIPAKRNEALYKKDCERLAMLKGDPKALEKFKAQAANSEAEPKVKAMSVDLTNNQVKKDFERLSKLRKFDANLSLSDREEKKFDLKFNLPAPKLGTGMKGGIIDFSEPITKNLVYKAKLNAVEWVKRNGALKKTNPNKIRPDKEVLGEKGVKRRREDEESEAKVEENARKENAKSKFQEMMEMKSAHSDLIDKRESEETEQYFKKLEVKEQMEEKMLSTYKVNCKAVRCLVCKYIAFSSSDLCKKLQHPIKVIEAVKRFFKCGDCGNRTICLDRIPTETCKRCASSKWIKAAMMDEKRTEIASSKLCIRGGEEKWIGSTTADASLNLLIPESD